MSVNDAPALPLPSPVRSPLRLPLRLLPDDALLRQLTALLSRSRRLDAAVVAHLGEVDARRLYLREACSSMFAYCTERLHFSEAEACLRIAAARAAREHPLLLEMLADGRLHLSGAACLAPHLTAENCACVLQRAVHRSKRQVLELVAELAPRPDAPTLTRRLPSSDPVGTPAVAVPPPDAADRPESAESVLRVTSPAAASEHISRQANIEPTAPGRYRVQFTASAELRGKLERLQDLMRTTVPDGDLATVSEAAVTEKLERMQALRFGSTKHPTSVRPPQPRLASRYVPAAVRRAVHDRDGGRCAYVDPLGRRCTAHSRLEYHHRRPYGHGGSHTVENLSLLCRAHNGFVAEIDCGRRSPNGIQPNPQSSG